MWRVPAGFFLFCCALFCQLPTAASLVSSLRPLSLDPAEVYHVRDLRLARGDLTIYLNEGVLAFAHPIGSDYVAAVFTTSGVDAGDAEVIVAPPNRGERASLAYFTKTPNLDEHFTQAIFVFSDATRADVMRQMEQTEVGKIALPDTLKNEHWNTSMQQLASSVEVPLIESLLDHEPQGRGVFYAAIGGNTLGPFEFCYRPSELESSLVGRVAPVNGVSEFQIWTSFNPKKAPSRPLPPFSTTAYKIDATVAPDLTVSGVTTLSVTPRVSTNRVIDMEIAQTVKVESATIDGKPAEVVQPDSPTDVDGFEAMRFLIVAPAPLPAGVPVKVEIRHRGTVIRDEGEGVYFVEARNIWFPHLAYNPATFDVTFRCPAKLRIVSSGKLASETVEGYTRIVHRVLDSPVQFIGFNLGDFVGVDRDANPFHVEFYANRSTILRIAQPAQAAAASGTTADNATRESAQPVGGVVRDSKTQPVGAVGRDSSELDQMAGRTLDLLHGYSEKWGPPATDNVSVTPIPGTFGQGFPGLIYLSVNSYLPPLFRPPFIRGSYLNDFYTDIMLAHEIAHQWWGNLVVTNDYRSGWLTEALANYAALEAYQNQKGAAAAARLLQVYIEEMEAKGDNSATVESQGPLNVGLRLRAINANAWRVTTYDKGTWVVRMLATRMGEDRFRQFERALLADAKAQGLSNDLFRKTAARFLPSGDPDPTLDDFFDAWVYGVGVPKLTLDQPTPGHYILRQSGVSDDFAVDVPVRVKSPGGEESVQWVRSSKDGTAFTSRKGTQANVSLPDPSDFLYLPG